MNNLLISDILNVSGLFDNRIVYGKQVSLSILSGIGSPLVSIRKKIANIRKKHLVVDIDGRKYRGQLFQGKAHGKGEVVYPDGSSHYGEWRNASATGRGILTLSNGDFWEGKWNNNFPSLITNSEMTKTLLYAA